MTLINLFIEFFKTGLFAIGGGLATLPFLYNIAEKYQWFTKSDISDMLAISESTPGPIGVNMATYAGFSTAGIIGGIVATFGLVLPSVIFIILISKALDKFSENKYVADSFYGLRPAVCALIAAAAVEVFKASVLDWSLFIQTKNILNLFKLKDVLLFALFAMISIKFKPHPIIIILIAALCGILFL